MAKRRSGADNVGDGGNPDNANGSELAAFDNGVSVSGDNGAAGIDPEAGEPGQSASAEPRKRRGRQPGTGKKAKKAPLTVTGVEKILLSCHSMLAGLTKIEEIEIDGEEAHELAEAVVAVNRHYNTLLDEKTIDWINLIMCCGSLYGQRLLAYRLRRMNEKKSAPAPNVPVDGSFSELIDLSVHRAS